MGHIRLTQEEAEYIYRCIEHRKQVECLHPNAPEPFYPLAGTQALDANATPFFPKKARLYPYSSLRKSPQQRRRLHHALSKNPVQYTLKRRETLNQMQESEDEDDEGESPEPHWYDQVEDPEGPLSWSILSTHPTYWVTGESTDTAFHAPRKNVPLAEKYAEMGATPPPETPSRHSLGPDGYLDAFDDVQPYLSHGLQFQDMSQVSLTYLGKVSGAAGNEMEYFDVDSKSTVPIEIFGQLKGLALLDTGATSSYMSMRYFASQPLLSELPKLPCATTKVIVGDGEGLKVHFAVRLCFTVRGTHRFEILTLVADIAPTFSLVIGLKNMVEIEGNFNARTLSFSFFNRSPFIELGQDVVITSGSDVPMYGLVKFPRLLNGEVVVKLFVDQTVVTMKLPIKNNVVCIGFYNTTPNDIVLRAGSTLGVADLRSMGYFLLPGKVVSEHLARDYTFQDVNVLCDAYNGMVKSADVKFSFDKDDPYPWLATDDWRRHATDHEILERQIDLSKSLLSPREKDRLLNLCKKHIKAFSLRDDVGVCPNIKVHIDLHDKTPFFVRPFPVAEEDKPWMDWQMERMVHLGILSKNSTTHTSPVMLISRKMTTDKRLVVDFRQLNSRVMKRNTTTPLMRDILATLGRAKIEVLSVLDFKDAYHSLRLDEESKEFCGIVPYFGAPCYRYERMPMGLSISPAMWIEYLNVLLNNIKNRECYIAIMDDLLAFGKKAKHFDLIADLLTQTAKHGLKISPRKCQFFVTEMVYMGNQFTISSGRMTLTPLKSRCDAIRSLPSPKTVKECKSFCGMVNYLSLFCPKLQEVLSPIYDLTRKGKVFKWTELQEDAFNTVKDMLCQPPVLSLPAPHGRFTLYTDTSRTHAGSALWQMQSGQNRLIGYASKSLPEAAQNYSVTELEMKGMLTGMMTWTHVLGRREFDCAIDHQAVVYILKAKTEPPTKRIMRLLEALGSFNFRLYYIKGKDLILADFLSRANIPDREHPNDLIPITISDRTEVAEYSTLMWLQAGYNVLTRRKAQQAGLSVPEVHGIGKALDPAKRPEHQKPPHATPQVAPEPHRPLPEPVQPRQPASLQDRDIPEHPQAGVPDPPSEAIPMRPGTHEDLDKRLMEEERIWRDQKARDDSAEVHVNTRHSVELPQLPLTDTDQPPLEVALKVTPPTAEHFVIPPALIENVDLTRVVHKHLPKQTQLDKVLKQIQMKLLRDTHLPLDLKDIEKHYLESPHFKDVYNYLNTGKLPTHPKRMEKTILQSSVFILLDKLLFVVVNTKHDPVVKLCVPTSLVDKLLYWYHTAVVGGHMGMRKCYQTLTERFLCPNLSRHVRAYIIGCHTCQIFKRDRDMSGTLQYRVNLDTEALTHFSMDIKHMIPGVEGYKYILVMFCEVSNFLVARRLKTLKAPEVCYNILEGTVCYFSAPKLIVCDQDPAFLSSLSQWMYKVMDIKLITCGPTNHRSLKAEAGIKALANLLKVHLTGFGEKWPWFVPLAMWNHNVCNSPNLDGLSPMHIALGRKGSIVPDLELNPDITVSSGYRDHYEKLKQQLTYFRERVERFRNLRIQNINKERTPRAFKQGQLVYMHHPLGAALQTASRKICAKMVGPLVIYKVLSQGQYLVMSLLGEIYPYVLGESRLIPGFIQTKTGNVATLADLKSALRDPEFKATPQDSQ